MGVPFNFTCSGVGVYVCSRCGFELFSSEDKVQESSNSIPNFTKGITFDSILKVPSEVISGLVNFRIVCGKCKIPVGNECKVEDSPGEKIYCVELQSLHFVPTKRCSVPLSFLF